MPPLRDESMGLKNVTKMLNSFIVFFKEHCIFHLLEVLSEFFIPKSDRKCSNKKRLELLPWLLGNQNLAQNTVSMPGLK